MTEGDEDNAGEQAPPEDLELGGNFDFALFKRVAERDISSAPSGDSLEPASLLRPLARFMGRRLSAGGTTPDACFFLLSASLEEDGPTLGPSIKRHHHFMRGKTYDPFGRLHFVASSFHEAVSTAHDCNDPDALHEWLKQKDLLEQPAAWVQGSDRTLTWYPNGFGDEAAAVSYQLTEKAAIDAVSIDAALDLFHDKTTREPFPHTSFWSAAALHVPCNETEKALQKALKIALDIYFHDDLVLREVDLPGSTVDFMIHQTGSGRPKPVCALELKVLREKHFNTDPKAARACAKRVNTQAVSSGLKQAAVARDAHSASMAFMAAFDMRKSDDDEILQTALKKHSALDVNGRRFFMHNSKSTYRAAPPAATAPKTKPVRKSGGKT